MNIKNILPILDWLPHYRKADLSGDLSAGLTVGVMLIPQGMAYSMLAGLPPVYGLYASLIPIIIYAFFGTSRQLAVGPVAMASLLVASGLAPLVSAESAPETYLKMAILLALLVGIFRLGLGLLRMGFLVNFMSQPVISGYTSAAAIIIAASQLKHLLGVKIKDSNYIHEVLWQTAQEFSQISIATVAIGIGGIVLLQIIKKVNKKYKISLPGPLAVVALGSVLVFVLGLEQYGLSIVGAVPSGLPAPGLPAFDIELLGQLMLTAATIGIIGFMESIAVAKAIEAKHKSYKVDSNQELIALGVANIGGAFFQGFPVNGGFSRSAVNDQTGARSPLAGLISAALILLTLLFLTPLFYYLPKAILASIIMVAVVGLIDYKELRFLWKAHRRDAYMLLLTFLATLFVGVIEGIALGVVLSLLLLIYRSSRPHVAVLGRVPNTDYYRNLKRFDNLENRPDLLIVRFDAEWYFANADFFTQNIKNLLDEKGKELKVLIFNAESVTSIDATAMHAIDDLNNDLKKADIIWFWCDVKGPVRDSLEAAGLTAKIGKEHFFIGIQDAVDFIDKKNAKSLSHYTLQTNKIKNK